MPRSKHTRFTVTGTEQFPLDMLRYDACWPHSTDDVLSIPPIGWDEGPGVSRSVTLVSASAPTDARWRSFGWTVTDVRPL